ncbi:hypothetical protein D9757_009347 [Collybiopsis confluens]|uniref:Uncharacterized protein n=1 Tax=Collybiopsis confluens TaxID=2823264 RepID=A0A8H5M213_9AGAR|nr:hypothetical protein D9757_009347 [Collybiopsis confluens]
MEQVFAIGYGLSLRYLVRTVSNSSLKLTGTLIGLWEGIILLHFTQKSPKSFDPYVAYGVRIFIDFLVTQNVLLQVLVLLWTGMGVVLADIAPSLWDDLGGTRIWSRFQRETKFVRRRMLRVRMSGVPIPSSRRRIVRFSNSSSSSPIPPPPPPPARSILISSSSSSSATPVSAVSSLPVSSSAPLPTPSSSSRTSPYSEPDPQSPSQATSTISDLPTEQSYPRSQDTYSSQFQTEDSDPLFSESDSDDESTTSTETPTPDAMTLRDISVEAATAEAAVAAAEAAKKKTAHKPGHIGLPSPSLPPDNLDDLAPKTPLPPVDQVPDIPDGDVEENEDGDGDGWEKIEKEGDEEEEEEEEEDIPTPTAYSPKGNPKVVEVASYSQLASENNEPSPPFIEGQARERDVDIFPQFASGITEPNPVFVESPRAFPETITQDVQPSPAQIYYSNTSSSSQNIISPLPPKEFPRFVSAPVPSSSKPEKVTSDSNWLENFLSLGKRKIRKSKGKGKSVGSAISSVSVLADAFVNPTGVSSMSRRDPGAGGSETTLSREMSYPHTRSLSDSSKRRQFTDMGVDLSRARTAAADAKHREVAIAHEQERERDYNSEEEAERERSPPPTFSQIYPDGPPQDLSTRSLVSNWEDTVKGGYSRQSEVGEKRDDGDDDGGGSYDGNDLYQDEEDEEDEEDDALFHPVPVPPFTNTDSTSTLRTPDPPFPEPYINNNNMSFDRYLQRPTIAMPIPTIPAVFPWTVSSSQFPSSVPTPRPSPSPPLPALPAGEEAEIQLPRAEMMADIVAEPSPAPIPIPPPVDNFVVPLTPSPLPQVTVATPPPAAAADISVLGISESAPDPAMSSYSSQASESDNNDEIDPISATAFSSSLSPTTHRLTLLSSLLSQITQLKKDLSELENAEKSALKDGMLGSELALKKAGEVKELKTKMEKMERKKDRVAFIAHNPDADIKPTTINLNDLSVEAAVDKMKERIQKLMNGVGTVPVVVPAADVHIPSRAESGVGANEGDSLSGELRDPLLRTGQSDAVTTSYLGDHAGGDAGVTAMGNANEELKSSSSPESTLLSSPAPTPSSSRFTQLEVKTPSGIKFRTVKAEVLKVLKKYELDHSESSEDSAVVKVRIPVNADVLGPIARSVDNVKVGDS